MKDIQLFPHNEEAYQSIIKSLEYSNFSFIERATGTGKSYILIKFLTEKMKNKRVLFITTHEPMFEQFSNRDMPALGTSKEIYDKLDLVIYPNINKKSAEWYFENYDCFIFDEAHHCGAPVWGETIGELRDLVRGSDNKIMIGATATGTRYLDDYMDVAENFFDNNVASRLSLSTAILDEILPAPEYINVLSVINEKIDNIKYKLNKIGNLKELEQIRKMVDELQQKFDLENDTNKLLKDYGVKQGDKYIIFCSNKDDLKQKMIEAQYWFKDIGNIVTYQAHSGQTKKQNQEQIDEFSKPTENNIKLMFAVDIFNEGMHIAGVDGVIMTRHTASPIVYLQQLGRALSFSVRKKQIKVFDLVGNASNIDVIYNLYKELLYIAETRIKNNEQNQEHYKNIIDRFKIVDKGNELLDIATQIDNYINNNYIIKNKIQRYIQYLENYTKIIDANFMDILKNGEIDKEHRKIFNDLCKYVNELSINDIYRLTKIGVIVSSWQEDKKVLENIKIHGSYAKVVENDLKETMYSYNEFYLKNTRLPLTTMSEEKDLAIKYRYYLTNTNSSKLKKYLKNVNYKLNIEEILILNGFPTSEEIDAYLDKIEDKYFNGKQIDELEIKTLRKIKLLKNFSDRIIITNLMCNKVIKIDESIKTIQKYINDYYAENNFIPLELIKLDINAYKSYKFIKNNYKYVTNEQFQILINMKIELFKELDMTMEERLKLLNGYQSINDLETVYQAKSAKDIVKFINEKGRRPDQNNSAESELIKKYNQLLQQGSSRWMNEICETLIKNKIKLSFNEKIIIGKDFNQEDLDKLYNDVTEVIKKCDKYTFVFRFEKKKIDLLKAYGKIDSRLHKIFIRTITLMESVFNQEFDKVFTIDNLEKSIWINKDVIPYNLISYINEREITLPRSLYNRLSNITDDKATVAHIKYDYSMKSYNKYMKYLKNNNSRPPKDDTLSKYIRTYLMGASIHDRKLYIKKLNELNIPILPEELFIANELSKAGENILYNQLHEKQEKEEWLNLLERYAYQTLSLRQIIKDSNDSKIYSRDFFTNELQKETSKEFIETIKLQIKENPNENIDFNGDLSILSDTEKKDLREYQLSCLADDFLKKVISKMKEENKALNEILKEESINLYREIKEYNSKVHKYDIMFQEIESINKSIILNSNSIIINDFIEEYTNFIKEKRKIPELISEDILERTIAQKQEIIFSISTIEEKKKLLFIGKKALEESEKLGLYDEFVQFSTLNERVPSILSDNPEEVKLAQLYQKEGAKLSKEQRKNILNLQKKYQSNTVKFFMSKKGK